MRDFYKLKDVIQQLQTHREFGGQFVVSNGFWENANKTINILQIPKATTKVMQNIGYGLADFYISWLRMKRSLTRITGDQSSLATDLLDALGERENLLLETPTMLSAMYLDPRIKGRLNSIQRECATISLEKLHIRLSRGDINQPNVAQNDSLDELNAEVFNDLDDGNNNQNSISSNMVLVPLREMFIKYHAVKPCDIKSQVFDFWRERKQDFPLLFDLACIIHAVHAGQCCVERNFSALQCVYDNRRCRLLPQRLSNILMIRLNKDVHEQWKNERIMSIEDRKI